MDPVQLCNASLSHLPGEVGLPNFNRSELKVGIVHLSVGNFCRSHLALYTHELMNETLSTDLGILGLNTRDNPKDPAMSAKLNSQDGLYTILEKDQQDTRATVCGSLLSLRSIKNGAEELLNILSNPQTQIVSMTITEGGYLNEEQMLMDANVMEDLEHPNLPTTVPGIIVEALNRRFNAGVEPFVVLSCDNLIGNGNAARQMIVTFAAMRDKLLAARIETQVSFPNSMVDRITPATSLQDIEICNNTFGIGDQVPVPCEPFRQWVIENRDSHLLPRWDLVGAQFVNDVHRYEVIKLRILNAGHSALGCGGFLAGNEYIHEIVSDPAFYTYLSELLHQEVAPHLESAPGMEIPAYIASILQRFSNPQIGDTALRICENSSAKFPTFVFPSVQAAILSNGATQISRLSMSVANWLRFLTGINEQGETFELKDPLASDLQPLARTAYSTLDVSPILKYGAVFGDLADSELFRTEVQKAYNAVVRLGSLEAIKSYQ